MNKETKPTPSLIAPSARFLIPAFCLATALAATGATYTWDGNGSPNSGSNWNNPLSWTANSGFPNSLAGDSVTIPAAPGQANNVVTVNGAYSVSAINFNTSTTVSSTFQSDTGTRTLTIGGGNTLFRQNLTLDGVVLNKSVGAGSFSWTAGTTMTLNNGGTWSLGSVANAIGQFSTTADKTITSTAGSGTVSVGTGAILRVSGGTGTITIQNGSGATSFSSTGEVEINQGTLALASTSTLGGTVDFNGASGNATLRNSGTLTANNLAVTFTGTGSSPLIENTAGTFTLSGTLALAAPISVTGGTLAGATTSASGTGNVSFTGGTLSPGGAGVGTLNLPAALNLSGGTLSLNITGDASADRVNAGASSTITLGGTAGLSVSSVDVTDGTVFTILSGNSISGTFAGLANGASINGGGQVYTVNYSGGNVTLTAVPEPQFYAGAAALGLLGFAIWRRQQKNA